MYTTYFSKVNTITERKIDFASQADLSYLQRGLPTRNTAQHPMTHSPSIPAKRVAITVSEVFTRAAKQTWAKLHPKQRGEQQDVARRLQSHGRRFRLAPRYLQKAV